MRKNMAHIYDCYVVYVYFHWLWMFRSRLCRVCWGPLKITVNCLTFLELYDPVDFGLFCSRRKHDAMMPHNLFSLITDRLVLHSTGITMATYNVLLEVIWIFVAPLRMNNAVKWYLVCCVRYYISPIVVVIPKCKSSPISRAILFFKDTSTSTTSRIILGSVSPSYNTLYMYDWS